MNKLQTNYDGGMPLELDDIRWEDAAVREALKGVIMGLVDTEDGVILQGCEITDEGTEYSIKEGFIYWQGEIFYVPSHVTTKVAGTFYWDIEVTYDPTGNETFEDVGVHDTYEIRRMKFYISETPPDPYMSTYSKTLIEVLKERLGLTELFDTGWKTEPYSPGYFSALAGTLAMSGAIIRYKIIGKTMMVSFEIDCNVSNLFTGLSMKIPGGKTVTGVNKVVHGSAACYSSNDGEIGVGADIPLQVATNNVDDTIYMKKPSSRVFADGLIMIFGQISIEID